MQGAHASTQIKKNEAEIFLSLNGMSGEEDEEKKVDRCNIFHRDVICKVDVKSRARKETKRMKKYINECRKMLGHNDTTENAHFSSFCLLFTLFRLDLPVKFNLNYLRIHEWWNSIRVIQCLRFVESLINY